MLHCDLNGVRVLVVEDDADTCDLFRTIFEMEGAMVATARGAWEGLKLVGQFSPDVVVSDFGLPDEDGCWLIRNMRAAVPPGARFPRAVIVTANGDGLVRARCARAGCDAFLTKPIDVLDLCGVVAGLAGMLPPPRLCAT
jgi:CheY-like chemotaxis protein